MLRKICWGLHPLSFHPVWYFCKRKRWSPWVVTGLSFWEFLSPLNWLEDKARVGRFPQFWFSRGFVALFGLKNDQGRWLFLLEDIEMCTDLVCTVDLADPARPHLTWPYYLRPSLNSPGRGWLLVMRGTGWFSSLLRDKKQKLDGKRCLVASQSLFV